MTERVQPDLPPLNYPPELPVVERRADIAAAIRDHQVVIIAGETGSGKTTQIPKIALEIGRAVGGQIGLTQPRRIAARSVAERISEELGVELGGLIGYQVRFTDNSSAQTAIKVMTDGILLNEMQRDRDLRRYDTIIIDEAHERSLNIDFILGTSSGCSASPRTQGGHHLGDHRPATVRRTLRINGRPAPIIEVSGRTYPVEVRYRPLTADDGGDIDQVAGICGAVEELWTEATTHEGGGR